MPRISFDIPEGTEIEVHKESDREGWSVPSFTTDGPLYNISINKKLEWKCSCPAWRKKDGCKHIEIVFTQLARKVLDMLIYRHKGELEYDRRKEEKPDV